MSNEIRGQFSPTQVKQLLQPIKTTRVLQAQGHSHVSQQDVTAHLIRMFGFGNFDIEVLSCTLIFESERFDKEGTGLNKWDVSYRGLVRLTIRNEDGQQVAFYENGSTGDAQNQSRAGGHDLAYKSAISLSIKRAAIALGDQFGLSLYNKGQMTALVRQTLVGTGIEIEDAQDGVEQQVSLGNDEIDKTEEVIEKTTPAVATKVPAGFLNTLAEILTEESLNELWFEATELGITSEVRAAFTEHKAFLLSVTAQEVN